MPIEVIRDKSTPTSHLPFSPAIKAGDFVFVSGQASVDESGKIVNDTFEGEFRRSLENTRKILHAAGLTFANVVAVRSYIDNPADLPEYNKLYRDYFKEPFPARTTIVNCLGGALKYEVDVTAYAGK